MARYQYCMIERTGEERKEERKRKEERLKEEAEEKVIREEEERIRTAGRKRPLSKLQPNSSISNSQVPPTYDGKEYYRYYNMRTRSGGRREGDA